MNPAVFILPGFLLLFVMTLMIGSAAWPNIRLLSGDREAWDAVFRYREAEKTQIIASWWAEKLLPGTTEPTVRDAFKTRLTFELAQFVFLRGDYPGWIANDRLHRRLLARTLRLCELDKAVLKKEPLKMRITTQYVRVKDDNLWKVEPPPADAAQPAADTKPPSA